MAESIFHFDDYKEFVRATLANKERGGRGQRLQLAKFLGCQDSYVSLVLNGGRHFSVEQGEAAARFLLLSEEEKEMFLYLLLRDRSGTSNSKKFFSEKIEEMRRRHLNLRNRVKIDSDLSDADKMTYYSNPLYAKVHMLLTIPGFWSLEKLAKRFQAPPEKMNEVCRFLTSKGMVSEKGGRFSAGTKFLFLDKRSPFISQHHANWRFDAVRAIQERGEEGLHLSMAVTLSEKDAESLRQKIAEFVQECSSVIKGSKEETFMAFCLDFYRP